MAEYIDREEVLRALNKNSITKKITVVDSTSVYDTVKNIPAADVAEVRHGKLNNIVDFGNGICIGYCSNCGTEHRAINPSVLKLSYRHCRWCGAKMDGKDGDSK